MADPRTPYRQTFFVGNRFLAETPRRLTYRHEEKAAPWSVVWVCRVCGEVYARAPVTDLLNRTMEYQVVTRICGKHTPSSMYDVPGSLWLPWDEDFTAALPLPALQYEFEQNLKAIEFLEGVEIK